MSSCTEQQNSHVQRMRSARNKGVVALLSYNKIRSKHIDDLVFAVEGNDDVVYYQTVLEKYRNDLKFLPLNCKGKDNVLYLCHTISQNQELNNHNTYFFVDKDFDGMKNYELNFNIYVTPTYSIENCIVNKSSLRKILFAEFKCDPSEGETDKIENLYLQRLREYFTCMELVNMCIFYCRIKGIKIGSIDDKIKNYLEINLNSLKVKYSRDTIKDLIRIQGDFLVEDADELVSEFKKLDPHKEWRGKFLIGFFIEFLKKLKDDRTQENPMLFKKKAKIQFEPNQSIIRSLAITSEAPACLQRFLNDI